MVNHRNGNHSVDKAYTKKMFESDEENKDKADKGRRGGGGVLTPEGEVARVRAANIRIFPPNILEE